MTFFGLKNGSPASRSCPPRAICLQAQSSPARVTGRLPPWLKCWCPSRQDWTGQKARWSTDGEKGIRMQTLLLLKRHSVFLMFLLSKLLKDTRPRFYFFINLLTQAVRGAGVERIKKKTATVCSDSRDAFIVKHTQTMLGHFYVQYSKIGVIQGVTLTVFHFFHSPEAYPELNVGNVHFCQAWICWNFMFL